MLLLTVRIKLQNVMKSIIILFIHIIIVLVHCYSQSKQRSAYQRNSCRIHTNRSNPHTSRIALTTVMKKICLLNIIVQFKFSKYFEIYVILKSNLKKIQYEHVLEKKSVSSSWVEYWYYLCHNNHQLHLPFYSSLLNSIINYYFTIVFIISYYIFLKK